MTDEIPSTESEEVVSEQEDINTIISDITENHQRGVDALMSRYNEVFESQENKIKELLNQIEDLKISKRQEIQLLIYPSAHKWNAIYYTVQEHFHSLWQLLSHHSHSMFEVQIKEYQSHVHSVLQSLQSFF